MPTTIAPPDPNTQSAYTAARYLLVLAGTWLAAHGYIKDANVNDAVSAVLIIGPIAWGFAQNYLNSRKAKTAVAVGVASGINLALQGRALASDGSVIALGAAAASSTPPKPVTVESAQKIVADFAPSEAPKAA